MATLIVEVISRGVNQTRTQLNGLTGAATKAAASITGLVSAGAALNKLVQSGRQLSVFQASLTTMTGSAENATKAFRELERFAAATPYTLDQAVNGFNKLVALGLDPSREALESYGNTAAAMGKDLSQLIEAVADAATGEFERLKEFGIKAKNQGDTIAFTFRGVRTEVQNNAAAIEGYLQGIGNNDFAGAMAERMKTLDGALSNLQDSWDGLFRTISQAGTGELIEESARAAIDALDELSAMIGSGQLQGYVAAWAESWKFALEDIANGNKAATSFIIGGWDELFQFIDVEGRGSAQVLSDAFWQFPANIRAIVQIATVEIAALADKAKAYGAEIIDSLSPFGDGGDYDGMQARLEAANAARQQSIDQILAERDATIAAYRVKIQSADEARRAYEDERKAAFDLGQFRTGGDQAGASGGTISKRLEKEKESAARLLEEIERLGATESQIIGYWYEDNLAKLDQYLAEGLVTRQEYALAQERLLAESVERQLAIDDRLNERRRSAEQKRTEEVRREVEAQYRAEEAAALEKERQFDRAAAAQASLTDQLRSTLGEQNAIYKASAIATATMDTYKAATGAYASLSSIPVVGPALGAAAAGAAIGFGLAQVRAITSTPNRAQGGSVSAGTPYMVGERGREVFVPSTSGTIVPNTGIGAMVNVTVIDQSTNGGNNVSVRQLTERDVEIIIADRVPRLMAEQQADPYSPFSKTQRATTSASRRL